MSNTTKIAVELEMDSDCMPQTVLQVVQDKIEEIEDFEIRGKVNRND